METPLFYRTPPQVGTLGTKAGRQRLVAFALMLAESTPLAPDCYELRLLKQFVAGTLTIEQVATILEAREYEQPVLPRE